jgi:hypothetical protein
MSLLMWSHEENGFAVLTDTLATTVDGYPLLFQSKVWNVPHLNMAIGGTGLAPLIEAWFRFVQTRTVIRDVTNLDEHAPVMLRELWAELGDKYAADFGRSVNPTCTIYHFGIAPDGQSTQYVYRSETDFASEVRTAPFFGIKPRPDWELSAKDLPQSPDDMIDLAIKLRTQEDAKPRATRVHIGGELIMTYIGDGSLQSERLHRFDDFDEQWAQMNGAPVPD